MNYLENNTFNLSSTVTKPSPHKPRVLVLYGSLRENSFSRFAAQEAGNILEHLGAEVRFFNPAELPMFDNGASASHPKVKELRQLVMWSEAQVWSSPEIHGNMSGVFKNQIDWIPLSDGAVRPTQGKTLAIMQVTGGSQSFNALNNMRVLGRWMRMLTIPNQSSVAKAWQEFNPDGTMKASPFRDRIVDVMEELMKFTLLTRDANPMLTDRFSERNTQALQAVKAQVAQADVLEAKVEGKAACC
ncbi:arsenical resistance protein ArsH [Thalassotalea euphylliae]|uniref:Arsenical resistance protein ArsH n=1 Tax=Thalassotalea euphylliae TaxID=1655234 RepID=A0A3E0UKI0_9GAMM|nr:arsenical resistance protein ArsH [Thalassotalea euphylliae]REL37157.1 arsenical resistance protein ArsH [Thalassotalea euphylliae]